MCGIAGAASRDAAFDVGPIVTRLTAALAHRGPDGEGFHFARGRSVGLGNRRLSIVDLPGGAQPIASEDERVWVTYNGEIYNHLDLRRELIALGHRFRTNADTEVLVHGFEAWGAELFGRLNGIFAFALLDGRSEPGDLWLVRDPAGVKPLYLGLTGETWWFASELAAARSCGVDSTIVTGLMRDGLRQAPQAFAVGFKDERDGELAMARVAAAELGVPLREVQVSGADYVRAWLEQAATLGEPIANTGILLVGLLCRAVRETHKVVLTGQGADEPLGG